jgi:hypothetical protein
MLRSTSAAFLIQRSEFSHISSYVAAHRMLAVQDISKWTPCSFTIGSADAAFRVNTPGSFV